jgi:hypothetical protein
MKRMFKQWWSTIPPISTKQATTSDLNSFSINNYGIENPGPGLGQTQKGGRVKLVNEILVPYPLYNWIPIAESKLHKMASFGCTLAWCNFISWLLGPSWPWSYGSWIYNYLCNQCLSLLMLWDRILIRARCTTLCDKVCQWLATGW